VSRAFEIFGDARRAATSKQVEPDENPYLARYNQLKTALHGDAAISFEDAQSIDLPTSPAMPAFDAGALAAAEMRHAMSYTSTSIFR